MRILCVSGIESYATNRLTEEAKKVGDDFVVTAPGAANKYIEKVNDFDVLYVRFAFPNFGEVISLAKSFQEAGKRVIDTDWTNPKMSVGKKEMYELLKLENIPIPKEADTFPLVAKWTHGSSARHVYLVKTKKELETLAQKYYKDQLILQELITADFEYKIIVIGFKALPKIVKYKIHPNHLTADIHNFEVVSANDIPEIVSLAEKSAKVINRQFAKVDILAKDSNYFVLEVNRSPGGREIEERTNMNIFGEFLKYIKKDPRTP